MAIHMKPIQPITYSFWIKGVTPLIQHAWSEKGLEMMRMTAAERRKREKTKRDPVAEAKASSYYTEDGDYGVPLLAFKAACIGACHKDQGLEKTTFRKSFFVASNGGDLITKLHGSDPIIREDIVRVGAGSTDIRYRHQFDQWGANIIAEVDPSMLEPEDIVKVVNRAGFSVGIGEWRPEKGGEFGRFTFDDSYPIEIVNTLQEAA